MPMGMKTVSSLIMVSRTVRVEGERDAELVAGDLNEALGAHPVAQRDAGGVVNLQQIRGQVGVHARLATKCGDDLAVIGHGELLVEGMKKNSQHRMMLESRWRTWWRSRASTL